MGTHTIYPTKKTLEAWDLLFKVEGSYCKNVSVVFEESYSRLLGILLIEPGLNKVNVRILLMARLPMTLGSVSHESKRMFEYYELLSAGKKVPYARDIYDSLVRVCQDLRLSLKETDSMKSEFIGQA